MKRIVMRVRPLRTLAAVLVLAAGPLTPAHGQIPSQSEIEQLLSNPATREAILRRIRQSGMSLEEIRTRLEAAGYSSSLLEQYLSQDSELGLGLRGDSLVQAMGLLGLGTAEELEAYADSLREVALIRLRGIEPEDAGLRVFGLDIFQRATTQFLPDLAGPVDDRYRLGPGDVLALIVTGDVELAHTLEVTREGFVVVPRVGQLFVNNLTVEQARQLFRQRLAQSYSGIRTGTTRFEITVARVRMIQVYVVGEVALPGSYQIPSVSTVVTALYHGGGPTERGNFRAITVRRGRDTVAVFDLYEYLLTGAAGSDVRLETGDVVFVPVHGPRVSVTGAVIRPAIYELTSGQTLADVVGLAGGFRYDAELQRLTVHRILPARQRGPGPFPRAVVDVPLTVAAEPGEGEAPASRGVWFGGVLVPALPLENGDSVVVDTILPLDRSLVVTIGGMVNKPGEYPWHEGMTLRELLNLARGPRVGADLREAEIARMPVSRAQGELAVVLRAPLDSTYLYERDASGRYVGPAGLPFPAAGSAREVTLEPYDQVTILRQPEFELQRTVTVTGEVQFPGPYAIQNKDERIADLVGRAVGVLPTAYVEGARFYREFDDAGRIDVDLPSAITEPGSRDDIILQPGDSLHIPEYIPTVRVTGAVNAPASVLFQPGAALDYYIDNAGGYARGADRARVSVRYANGSARPVRQHLFFTSKPKPGPGSVVTVPSKPEGEPLNVTLLMGSIAQILAATVAIVAIATR
jgi:protein involved in polysaccharide export with SLBB domain